MKGRAADGGPRYLCVHGHFYQPPRENPWLESIERQPSARPYHDWNDRIHAECYAQNVWSRRLDERDRVARVVNNFERMSFNVGPTLLAWMEREAPETYAAILRADAVARERTGHGSAMAQAHGHIIMPLANARDRATQVAWGIADFRHRFGHAPEGMWLPETAVDLATLDEMAARGVRFTVLAPRQARAVRPLGATAWAPREVPIDPSRAYVQRLPSGRSIALFFYDGPVSQAVAFERLLNSGLGFAGRLAGGFSAERTWPQLMHIATDGETYGHHHRHGDMALAHALAYIEEREIATIATYGEFLAKHPPAYEVDILEGTSWSCAHGVERWRADCGCNTGGSTGFTQKWRAPLREAFDWLRDAMAPRYEEVAGAIFADPWAARDDYIRVVLDRSSATIARFFEQHARGPATPERAVRGLELLELQRHAMLMYTSCGWFFDDVSGIETVQDLLYAGRATELARRVLGLDLEGELLERLGAAQSNLAAYGDARRIYLTQVKPAQLDLADVAAHVALRSLFTGKAASGRVHCYDVATEAATSLASGPLRVATGLARVRSSVTLEEASVSYGVLHFGGEHVAGGLRRGASREEHDRAARALEEAVRRADPGEAVRLLGSGFGERAFSLRALLRDERHELVTALLEGSEPSLGPAPRHDRYERRAPLLRLLGELGVPLPREARAATELALHDDLAALLGSGDDDERAKHLIAEARRLELTLDTAALEHALRLRTERAAQALAAAPADAAALAALRSAVDLVAAVPFPVDVWRAQSLLFHIVRPTADRERAASAATSAEAESTRQVLREIAEKLRVRLP